MKSVIEQGELFAPPHPPLDISNFPTRAEAEANKEAATELRTSWQSVALEMFRQYLDQFDIGHEFLMEDAREWISTKGIFPEPEDGRAWGAVTTAALKVGWIEDTGRTGRARTSNNSKKPLWRVRQ